MFLGLPFSIAIFYIVALAIAILKDLLDLAFITSLPGIGSILTLLFSGLIFILIFLAGIMGIILGKGKTKISSTMRFLRFLKRFGVFLGGTVTEELLGLNFFPFETVTVAIIMWMHGHSYKKAKKEKNQGS